MNSLFDDGIHIVKRDDLNHTFTTLWSRLFQRCFGGTEKNAVYVFQKYLLNDSRICYSIKDGIMVAAYCGLKLRHEDAYVFLSTDTMSDGTQKGSSIILGKRLYKFLIEDNIEIVCGYPNKNIRKIREKGLGWTLNGHLYLYIGIPFLWRLFRNSNKNVLLWKATRPEGGWFTREKPLFVNLLGPEGLYSANVGAVITLSAYRPGPFFIKVPDFLFEPRNFGYKLLTENAAKNNVFLKKIAHLNLDTIDIP
ncbi:glycosyltransferase family 2 protein [Pseudomonas fluorescens]|uniref:Glycosyltransferase family 2 protein n=1 Tax=Pseudomonas fluorescens TaxID=294 RepID=A0A7Z6QLT8_PSEFL|nr:glycosyltransferase family 2 protein [Pseudomonas fluorescens]RDS88069.1 glycosyltransferase family 2 protein [Pseudomonas fluorescens]